HAGHLHARVLLGAAADSGLLVYAGLVSSYRPGWPGAAGATGHDARTQLGGGAGAVGQVEHARRAAPGVRRDGARQRSGADPGAPGGGRLVRHHRSAHPLSMSAPAIAQSRPGRLTGPVVLRERRAAQVLVRIVHSRSAVIGGSLLALVILAALAAPLISPYDPI